MCISSSTAGHTPSLLVFLLRTEWDEGEKYRAVYMKSRLRGFRSICHCVASSPGQQTGRIVRPCLGFVALPLSLRYRSELWLCNPSPRASGRCCKKKTLRLFQHSPGCWTGFNKLQGEDLQVSSENSVPPQPPLFWWPMILLKLVVNQVLASYCSSKLKQHQCLHTCVLGISTSEAID